MCFRRCGKTGNTDGTDTTGYRRHVPSTTRPKTPRPQPSRNRPAASRPTVGGCTVGLPLEAAMRIAPTNLRPVALQTTGSLTADGRRLHLRFAAGSNDANSPADLRPVALRTTDCLSADGRRLHRQFTAGSSDANSPPADQHPVEPYERPAASRPTVGSFTVGLRWKQRCE